MNVLNQWMNIMKKNQRKDISLQEDILPLIIPLSF